MSTNCITVFTHNDDMENPIAIIYRHSDGYPEVAGVDIYRFFQEVKAQTRDTRFNHASYLAAKYVVWLARSFAVTFTNDEFHEKSHANERPMDFLSVGIVNPSKIDSGYHDYIYVINCGARDEDGFPVVKAYDSRRNELIIPKG